MSTVESAFERLVAAVPKPYRRGFDRLSRAVRDRIPVEELAGFARRVRNRFPPVVLEHRIDALERHIDRRFKELEHKLDEVLRGIQSRAA